MTAEPPPARFYCQRCDAEMILTGNDVHAPCRQCGANHWATWRAGKEPWGDDVRGLAISIGPYYRVTIRR